MRKSIVVFSLLVLAMPCQARTGIIYVDPDANGLNDGTSWADAYKYFQDALAAACYHTGINEVRAADGIYKPDEDSDHPDGSGDRTASFQLINGVALRGGYAGFGNADPDARNVDAYKSILSGDLGGNDIDTNDPCDLLAEPRRAENSYHVVAGNGIDSSAVLDGFTVTGGNADDLGFPHDCGGGMRNESGSPTVTNCAFTGNSAKRGGGMQNFGGSGPTIANCTFHRNAAILGGGIHNCNAAYSNPRTYRVTRTLTIRNETARVDRLKVWMPMVIEGDSQQNVVMEATTPYPQSIWEDPQYASGVLYWEFRSQPSKGSSVTITEQFVYTCFEVDYFVEPEKIAPYDKDGPEYVLYTRSGPYLEADDAGITQAAEEIGGDETNPYSTARTVYEWVIDHMRYRAVEGLKGAKFAFENGYGECGDYAALFVALCRAIGIPARPVVGRWATSKADDWHCWAEFYLPGYGWVPADPTMGEQTGELEGNFGRLDNKRLTFNKTYNVVLHPRPYFFAPEVGFLQTFFWEYHGGSGVIHCDLEYSVTLITGSGGLGNSVGLPIVTNCTFSNNAAEKGSGMYNDYNARARVTNCIFWANIPDQIYTSGGTSEITYSDVQGGWPGEANIDIDPLFAEAANGDYHLKSEAGRWDANSQSWVIDEVTSPCVDAGDPNSDWAAELWPHGRHINMGAFGGTPQASMSESGIGNPADFNNDDIVDWKDLLRLADMWLAQKNLCAEDINRNGLVNFSDFGQFALSWLCQQ